MCRVGRVVPNTHTQQRERESVWEECIVILCNILYRYFMAIWCTQRHGHNAQAQHTLATSDITRITHAACHSALDFLRREFMLCKSILWLVAHALAHKSASNVSIVFGGRAKTRHTIAGRRLVGALWVCMPVSNCLTRLFCVLALMHTVHCCVRNVWEQLYRSSLARKSVIVVVVLSFYYFLFIGVLCCVFFLISLLNNKETENNNNNNNTHTTRTALHDAFGVGAAQAAGKLPETLFYLCRMQNDWWCDDRCRQQRQRWRRLFIQSYNIHLSDCLRVHAFCSL